MEFNLIINLISHFFIDQRISVVTVINCWSENENLQLTHALSKLQIYNNIINLNNATAIKRKDDMIQTLSNNRNHSVNGIYLDYDCEKSAEIIDECTENNFFSINFNWLIYEAKYKDNNALQKLKSTNLLTDCQIAYADHRITVTDDDNSAKKVVIPLYDVYNNGFLIGGRLNVTFDRYFVHDPNSGKGYYLTKSKIGQKLKYENRINMSDVSMRIATVFQLIPLNSTDDEVIEYLSGEKIRNNRDTYNLVFFKIAMMIRDILNYNITWMHHNEWIENENLTGAFNSLQLRKVDQMATVILVNELRLRRTSTASESHIFHSIFVYRSDGNNNAGLLGDIFFKPFDFNVWLCTIAAIVVIGSALRIIAYYEISLWSNNGRPKIEFMASWYLTMITSFGAFCQQGASIEPTTIPGKTVHIFLWITSILLYNYYTSQVVSSLIESPTQVEMKNLYELADSRFEIGFENIAYTKFYFKATTRDDVHYLLGKKTPKTGTLSLLYDPKDGIERVRRTRFAFNGEASTLYSLVKPTFSANEICDLKELLFRPREHLGFMIWKNSPYLEVLKIQHKKIRQTGILNRLQVLWFPKKPKCEKNSIVVSVGLEYTSFLFLFLAISIVVCLAILLIEHIDFGWGKKKRHN